MIAKYLSKLLQLKASYTIYIIIVLIIILGIPSRPIFVNVTTTLLTITLVLKCQHTGVINSEDNLELTIMLYNANTNISVFHISHLVQNATSNVTLTVNASIDELSTYVYENVSVFVAIRNKYGISFPETTTLVIIVSPSLLTASSLSNVVSVTWTSPPPIHATKTFRTSIGILETSELSYNIESTSLMSSKVSEINLLPSVDIPVSYEITAVIVLTVGATTLICISLLLVFLSLCFFALKRQFRKYIIVYTTINSKAYIFIVFQEV